MKVIDDVFWKIYNKYFKASFEVFEKSLNKSNIGLKDRKMITTIGCAHFDKLFYFLTCICNNNTLYSYTLSNPYSNHRKEFICPLKKKVTKQV